MAETVGLKVTEEKEKQVVTMDNEMFYNMVGKIESVKSVDELKEIGKELMKFSPNGYKRALLEIYKERKEKLLRERIESRESLRIIRNSILFGGEELRKMAARLVYALGEEGVYEKEVVSYLIDLYREKNGNDVK